MLIRIKPEQVALGMYVQGFEGSWLSHPFWRAKFIISAQEDLTRIRDGGTDIFIDTSKGMALATQEAVPRNDCMGSVKTAPGGRKRPHHYFPIRLSHADRISQIARLR